MSEFCNRCGKPGHELVCNLCQPLVDAENESKAANGQMIANAVLDSSDLSDREKLTDALTNLMHWADLSKDEAGGPLSFNDRLEMAREHYEAEISGEL